MTQPFEHFIRFFTLSEDGRELPQNALTPTERHPVMPILGGDVLRFLVPQADIPAPDIDDLQINLVSLSGRASLPGVGRLRRQDGEVCSRIRLRVNSAPGPGERRQFALLGAVPNPARQRRNVALLRPVTVSSQHSAWDCSTVVDGGIEPAAGSGAWASGGPTHTADQEQFVAIDLGRAHWIDTIRLLPFVQGDGGLPVDFVIEVSQDGTGWEVVFRKTGENPVTTLPYEFRTYQLEKPARAVHVRLRATKLSRVAFDGNTFRLIIKEMEVYGFPADEPETLPATVMGTFYGQQNGLSEYISAIRAHYENYPYTPVSVDQFGNELLIRAYHGRRFRLGNQPLTVSLGKVRSRNGNHPSLVAQRTATTPVGAQDSYRATVGEDIEAGNLFRLGSAVYTADGTETPAQILTALGVPDGRYTVAAGTALQYSAEVGSVTLQNRNEPTLTLTYSHSSGGQDYYNVAVGLSLQPGNVFQIAVSGQPTRTRIAATSDTAASIQAFFGTSGGFLAVPSGVLPLASTLAGTRSIANTNAPRLTLSDRIRIPATTEDTYQVVIGTSIRKGNVFVLGSKRVIATDSDNVLTIAEKLGYGGYPFTVKVPGSVLISANALPDGLAFSTDTLTVTGRVQEAGQYLIQFVARNGQGVERTVCYVLNATEPAGAPLRMLTPYYDFESRTLRVRVTSGGTAPVEYRVAGLRDWAAGNEFSVPMWQAENTTFVLEARQGGVLVTTTLRTSREGSYPSAARVTGIPAGAVRLADQSVSVGALHTFTLNAALFDDMRTQPLTAYAERGTDLDESKIADVELVEGAVWMRGLPYVAEVFLPRNLTAGRWQLEVENRKTGAKLALSNALQSGVNATETVVLRYGDNYAGSGRTLFGYWYGEPGLMQQLRLRLGLTVPVQRQSEVQYQTLDGRVRLQSARSELICDLTTDVEPAVFHRALFAALKHPVVYINGTLYRCEGELRETVISRRLGTLQSQALLVVENSVRETSDFISRINLLTMGRFATIERQEGAEGISIYVRQENAYTPVSENMRLAPGSYEVLVRCESEPRRMVIYRNDRLCWQVMLTPRLLSLAGRLDVAGGDSVVIRLLTLNSIPITKWQAETVGGF